MKKLYFLLIAISLNLSATTHYVSKTGDSTFPYTNWATAANSIQEAVLSALNPGDIVLVADGVYYPADEIYIVGEMTVKSVNGADKTIVDGDASHRCFSLASPKIILDGFTISNGFTDYFGGGVFGGNATVQNCIISENSAFYGGGAYCHKGTVQSCLINGNSASYGGGVYCYSGGTVQNCTICDNTSGFNGGGGNGGTIYNSIIYYNTAGSDGDNLNDATVEYSCSFPLYPGEGNTNSTPEFINRASGNYRLNSLSPCIDSGTNAFAGGDWDLDGNPRIIGGIVDMGAYEFAPEP